MIKVQLSGRFHQIYKGFTKHPELRALVFHKIDLFKRNPDDSRLRNHKLTGRMEGKWSFSIDGDIRIVYEWIGKSTVRFLAIGAHKEVYSKPD